VSGAMMVFDVDATLGGVAFATLGGVAVSTLGAGFGGDGAIVWPDIILVSRRIAEMCLIFSSVGVGIELPRMLMRSLAASNV
jgi:hypothetical protein